MSVSSTAVASRTGHSTALTGPAGPLSAAVLLPCATARGRPLPPQSLLGSATAVAGLPRPALLLPAGTRDVGGAGRA